jgi:phage-related protein
MKKFKSIIVQLIVFLLLSLQLSFAASPTITSFSPKIGGKGTIVTINGTNFYGTPTVTFGGTMAVDVQWLSVTQLTAKVGTGTSGLVKVTTTGGTAISTEGFTWIAAPTISSISKTSGGTGTSVTILGNNFTGATRISFGGTDAASFTVKTTNQIIATVGNGATGTVSVTTPGGTTTYGTFTWYEAPVFSYTPITATYGTAITIRPNLTGGEITTYSISPTLPIGLSMNSITGEISGTPTAISPQSDYTVTATGVGGTSTATVTIAVDKIRPTIHWDNPDDIEYGTLLSATQLNATVDLDGVFTYNHAIGDKLNAGTNDLTVNFIPNDETIYSSVSKTVSINVTKIIPTIIWNNPDDIVYGTPLNVTQLNATAGVDGIFTYDHAINEKLTAGTHDLKVTFTPTDNVDYATVSKTVTINISQAQPSIDWNNPDDIVYGTLLSTTQLNATVDANIPGTFTYIPAIGTVLNAGNNQTLKVNFTPIDNVNYTAASKIVTINVTQATPVITWDNPDDIEYGTRLSATQLNAIVNDDIPGTLIYTPSAGTILNMGNGQILKVDFAPTDNVNYVAASKTVTINVTQVIPTITWRNPDDIQYGTLLSAIQLNAAADVDGSFTYDHAIGDKLNAGMQTLKVDFIPRDNINYTSVSKTVSINVAKAIPVIFWSNPDDIVYGTHLSITQLNATSDVDGMFTYDHVLYEKLNAGTQTLKVDFTPIDNVDYAAVSKTVLINVAQATPNITWRNPDDIMYGTLLSTNQLNATSDVDGFFTYDHAIGEKLTAGTHDLKVTFTPADNVDYAAVSKTTSINIAQATPNITWNNPDDIVYGTILNITHLNATSDIDGSFTYDHTIGEKLSAGTHDLKVTFTPNDPNYTTASKTIFIHVIAASLSVSTSSVTIKATKNSTASVNVTSNTSWTATCDQDWLTVNTTSGNGNQTLSFSVTANISETTRIATVTISAEGVPNQSITITQDTEKTGTNTQTATTDNIICYPNPVAEGFQVSGIEGKAMLTLTDISGKALIMKEINGNEYIPATALPKGVYIIKIATQSGTIDKKLIKK